MDEQSLSAKFMELFAGLMEAHGFYDLTAAKVIDGKLKGIATTFREPVTELLWTRHLKGEKVLGIVPINRENKCKFGVIDIDAYDLDLQLIAKRIAEYNLPLVLFRSKSGGAHIYLFTVDPIPADLMQSKLKEFRSFLGFGNSEIFPKQVEILLERNDFGSWINMPYYDCNNPTRYAFDRQGKAISASGLFDYVASVRISEGDLRVFRFPESKEMPDGPPCLQHLWTNGFPPNNRNKGLFNTGVYLRKAHPDTWQADLEKYNQRLSPPLDSREVQGTIKSLNKKDYQYTCKDQPICAYCNATLCKTRKFGVGGGGILPAMSNLTKIDTEPATWFLNIELEGKLRRLELSTEDIQNQLRFQRQCMEKLSFMPPLVKTNEWQEVIQKLLEGVDVIALPEDSSARGQFIFHLGEFCTSRVKANEKDEILLGKPWLDTGYYHIRLNDLLAYLDRKKFFDFRVHQISSILKDLGSKAKFFNIKGKGVNCWLIPESLFTVQDEAFTVPKTADTNPF